MKVSRCVIQDRNIEENSISTFCATYKGKRIYVSTDHGFGKPQYDHLTRYYIYVIDVKTGMYDVDSYQDVHTMQDAIRYALKGSCLIK